MNPPLDRPIFVLGAPRSGTSFLGRLFTRHPDVAYASEPRLVWRYGNDGKSDCLKVRDARPEVRAYIDRHFRAFVAADGKQRLVEKTPSNALRPAFIQAVFPEARFVHVIRNGYDSALSIRAFWQNSTSGTRNIDPGRLRQRLREIRLRQVPHYGREFAQRFLRRLSRRAGPAPWGPRLPGLSEMVRDLDLLEVCCLQWRTCVETTRAFGQTLPPERFLELRLEEFSEAKMGEILDFCELTVDDAISDFIRERFSPDKAGSRRKSATEEDYELMRPWIGSTLDALGYSR